MQITHEEVVLTEWKLKIMRLTFTLFGHERPCFVAGYSSCVDLSLRSKWAHAANHDPDISL